MGSAATATFDVKGNVVDDDDDVDDDDSAPFSYGKGRGFTVFSLRNLASLMSQFLSDNFLIACPHPYAPL